MVASVEVTPSSATTIEVGQTVQMSVTAKDAAGNVLTGRTVTWSSSDDSKATVSGTGLVTGMGAGAATITATCEAKSGTAAITVTSGDTGLGIGFGSEQFAEIPAGTFQMGDITGNGFSFESPVHTVNITKQFYMQRTEVTQGQWRAVMGNDPSHFKSCGDTCPVELVNWNDVQDFLTTLNAQDPGKSYRLPTEAEWEYAARAGTTGEYGGTGDLEDMGWYGDWLGNARSMTHPAAEKQPNDWGLYDMHGNVWEWVQDWYSATYYGVSPPDDPTGPPTGTKRGLRGGSWRDSAYASRSARRLWADPTLYNTSYGFRLARTR
jgi:formylglycine-generating enzyme required for sulfatase activity